MINEKELEETLNYYSVKVNELLNEVSDRSSKGIKMYIIMETIYIGLDLFKRMVGLTPAVHLVKLWLKNNAKEGK